MAVTNGWGQGVDNTIDWGKGSTNNSNDWGSVYGSSAAGDTLLSGASFSNTRSLDFDGVDDYVDCGTGLGNSQGVISNFSVSMWIKPSITSGNDLFFNVGSFSNSFGQISIQLQGNRLYFKLNNGTRTYYVAYTNTTNWEHIVFVYDGSNSANTKLYINNVVQSTSTGGLYPSSLDLTGLKTIIGAGYSTSYTYSGLLDEVSYFNSSLSATDINTIYNSGTPGDLSSLSPLGWWRFEEGSGTTATDSGSGSNDGTIINGATYSTDVPS
tara:strand:- start:472 stop:1275 length:804 start_codon:yes stop_codon:yes gene_type:complete